MQYRYVRKFSKKHQFGLFLFLFAILALSVISTGNVKNGGLVITNETQNDVELNSPKASNLVWSPPFLDQIDYFGHTRATLNNSATVPEAIGEKQDDKNITVASTSTTEHRMGAIYHLNLNDYAPFNDTARIVNSGIEFWGMACLTGNGTGMFDDFEVHVVLNNSYEETVLIADVVGVNMYGEASKMLSSTLIEEMRTNNAYIQTLNFSMLTAANGANEAIMISDKIQVYYAFAQPPDAPEIADIGLSPLGYPRINFSPNWNGSADITSWSVYRSESSGVIGDLIASNLNSNNPVYEDSSAVLGHTYYYSVTCTNIIGTSNHSAQMSKLACRVPTAPVLDATVVNHPDGNVELTWTASNPRGSAVINYYIERTITPSEAFSWVSVGSVAGTETKFNDTSIPSYGTVYYYRVYANNVAGDSDRSNERSCRPYRTPSAPTLVSVAAGTGSNTITWIASEHTYNTTSITYTLWWGIDSSNINNSIVLLEGQSPYEHAGIFSYEYFYYIEAKNHLGWSTNSSTLSAQPYGPPTHVQNLAIVVGNFTANLTWNAPEFNGGSAVSGYRIYRQRESDAEILLESNIETTYYNDVVSEYGEYTYRIVALNSYGEGNSNSISGKPNTTPMAIPQIIITSGFKCIILNWDEPADGGYEITQYLIYRGNPEGSHELIQSQTGRFFNHTNLVPGTKYNYYVIAQNILGDGKPSQVVVAYPDYVPSPPVNITKTTTLYSIVLGWGKAPQLDGVSIPNKYHIFRGTDAANLEQIAIVDAKNINSYNDSTAVAGTKYYYKISSLNQYGLGSQSEVIAGYRLVKITLNSESTKEGPVLTWEAVPNAAYYSVYRAGYQSIDIEELSPIANSITELTYTDVDAIDQGVYFYVVVAYDADGEIMGISDSKNEMALADSMADKTIKAIMDNLLYIIIGVVAIVGIVIYRVYRKRKYMSF